MVILFEVTARQTLKNKQRTQDRERALWALSHVILSLTHSAEISPTTPRPHTNTARRRANPISHHSAQSGTCARKGLPCGCAASLSCHNRTPQLLHRATPRARPGALFSKHTSCARGRAPPLDSTAQHRSTTSPYAQQSPVNPLPLESPTGQHTPRALQHMRADRGASRSSIGARALSLSWEQVHALHDGRRPKHTPSLQRLRFFLSPLSFAPAENMLRLTTLPFW